MSGFMEEFDEFDECDAFDRDGGRGRMPLSANDVLRAWLHGIRREEPWCQMPLDDRHGAMRRVIAALLDIDDDIDGSARRRRIVNAAARHGAFRRAQGCPSAIIRGDFILLRNAFRDAVLSGGASSRTARRFVRALLPDVRRARHAAAAAYAMLAEWRGNIDEQEI